MESNAPDRTLDVRTIDGMPFSQIMDELDTLNENEQLELIAPHEPLPLYDVLDERGLSYESTEHEPDEWHVFIER